MTLLETIQKNAKTSKWVGILLLIAGFGLVVARWQGASGGSR